MNEEYKICTQCGAKVNALANFCPECKSQSFKKKAVLVRRTDEPVSLTHKLFYWNYDGYFVLSKTKLTALFVFVLLFSGGFAAPSLFALFALAFIFAALTFVLGYSIHMLMGRPSDEVLEYNDYGLLTDLYHLLFFWQNKKTGQFVLSKTKIISFLVFLACAVISATVNPLALLSVVGVAVIFEIPVFFIGWGVHKLVNPYPTNPKVETKKPPKKVPKKEPEPAIDEEYKKPVEEPEPVAKFEQYENKVNDLNDEFAKKEKVARQLIEKRFVPPQITYTRFITMVDKASEIFKKEYESAINILHLATEDSPRIDRELESKIGIMETIIDKIEDLTNELILSMDSSKDSDVDTLIEDMEDVISSVKDYKK